MAAASTPARASASRAVTVPSSWGARPARLPPKLPMAVRAPPRMTTESRRMGFSPDSGLAQQRAGNDFLHDLRGAGIDGLHPGIQIEARDGVFAGVAVAAEQLQAGIGTGALHLGEAQLEDGGLGGAHGAMAVLLHALLEVGAAQLDVGLHLGQGEAGVLEVAHPLAEGARSEERRVGKECRARWSP